jgi:signal transduction histidine kinase
MNRPGNISAEVAAELDAWRDRGIRLFIGLVLLLISPVLVMVLTKGLVLPMPCRVISVGLLVLMLVAWWRKDWGLRRRVIMVLTVCYSMAVMRLAMNGLVGSGRWSLFVLPLATLILAGSRAGWIALGISVAIFGTFTALAGCGLLAPWLEMHDNSTDAAFWLAQGFQWLALLVPVMVLFGHFQTRQTAAMIEERRSRREIEAVAAERRRLEEALTGISEQERARIGAELHDGLCQQLTAALLTCTALENELAAREAHESEMTRRLRRSLEECIGSAYAAAKGLSPVGLSSDSLAPALERLASQAGQSTAIACELRQADPPPPLPPATILHLYRIAQEAVHNAVKHARCRHIILELLAGADSFTLKVMDDGYPSTGARVRPGGLGIQIMAYRAHSIGGALWIEHPAAGGTTVICRIPCHPQAAATPSPQHDTQPSLLIPAIAEAGASLPG